MVFPFSSKQEKEKKFLDIFPVPEYLLLGTAGVSLSDDKVRFVEFKNGAKGTELSKCGEVDLPQGAVDSGYVNDQGELSKALIDLSKGYGFKYIHATLPEEKAYLFTTEVNKVEFVDLNDAVAFTIEENVPVALSKSVFDFDIIGDPSNKEKVKVAVSVLPTKVIETYTKAFESAGLIPISFDVESQAISRALVPSGDARPHLILNISENKTGLYVVEDEVVQFSSTPAYGSGGGRGSRNLANLKSEVRKVFAFWNTRLDRNGVPQKKIEKIILTGPGAIREDFVSEFMSDMEIEYVIGNVWENAFSLSDYVPDVSYEDSLGYAASVGAALGHKQYLYV